MAYDKAVDSTVLETGLTTIADAIRAKGGTSAPLEFPQGMADAVAAISGGKPEEEKTVEIVTNGTTEILPAPGSVLAKVTANVSVPTGGGGEIERGTFVLPSISYELKIPVTKKHTHVVFRMKNKSDYGADSGNDIWMYYGVENISFVAAGFKLRNNIGKWAPYTDRDRLAFSDKQIEVWIRGGGYWCTIPGGIEYEWEAW